MRFRPIKLDESAVEMPENIDSRDPHLYRDATAAQQSWLTFQALPHLELTVIGRQKGRQLVPANLDHTTKKLLIIPGEATFEKIRAFQRNSTRFFSYSYFFYGFCLNWLGFLLFLAPFRNRFKNASFLDRYHRSRGILLSVPWGYVVLLAFQRQASRFSLIFMELLFLTLLALFIAFNRDPPKAKITGTQV